MRRGERNTVKGRDSSWSADIPPLVSSLLFIAQIIIGIYLLPVISQNQILAYAGVGLYSVSGVIFGLLPIFEFRRKGGVQKGKSYIHTTKLVDTGIYSIVRHPQYVTFMLWAIAGMLLFQHWIVICLGLPIFPLTYLDLIHADKEGLNKFQDEYKIYMEQVPRANFLLGIFRLLLKGKQ
jgi:protein-S-isoprenylcysteine O-methyltransferase Ste14